MHVHVFGRADQSTFFLTRVVVNVIVVNVVADEEQDHVPRSQFVVTLLCVKEAETATATAKATVVDALLVIQRRP